MGARILLLGIALGAIAALQPASAARPATVLGISPSSAPLWHTQDAPDLRPLADAYRLPPDRLLRRAPVLRESRYLPSSAKLTLGALATLGVARGLRALKSAACAHCPQDWHWDLAPSHDHTLPIEPNVTFLAVYAPARPLSLALPVECRPSTIRVAPRTRWLALLVATPRGPPTALPHISVSGN